MKEMRQQQDKEDEDETNFVDNDYDSEISCDEKDEEGPMAGYKFAEWGKEIGTNQISRYERQDLLSNIRRPLIIKKSILNRLFWGKFLP